jgi:hypothetical protein
MSNVRGKNKIKAGQLQRSRGQIKWYLKMGISARYMKVSALIQIKKLLVTLKSSKTYFKTSSQAKCLIFAHSNLPLGIFQCD